MNDLMVFIGMWIIVAAMQLIIIKYDKRKMSTFKEAIQKRILELKSKPLSVETKLEIQKLQQMLDETDKPNTKNISDENFIDSRK